MFGFLSSVQSALLLQHTHEITHNLTSLHASPPKFIAVLSSRFSSRLMSWYNHSSFSSPPTFVSSIRDLRSPQLPHHHAFHKPWWTVVCRIPQVAPHHSPGMVPCVQAVRILESNHWVHAWPIRKSQPLTLTLFTPRTTPRWLSKLTAKPKSLET